MYDMINFIFLGAVPTDSKQYFTRPPTPQYFVDHLSTESKSISALNKHNSFCILCEINLTMVMISGEENHLSIYLDFNYKEVSTISK